MTLCQIIITIFHFNIDMLVTWRDQKSTRKMTSGLYYKSKA